MQRALMPAVVAAQLSLVVWLFGAVAPALARTIYVDNASGDDRFDGLAPRGAAQGNGPCRTISQALLIARAGDRIEIAKTDRPYHESVTIQAGPNSGLPLVPFVIEGNGAILDGSVPVPGDAWEHVREDVYRFRPSRMTYQQLFLDSRPVERVPVPRTHLAARPELGPLQWCLHGGHVYFRAEAGRTPRAYNLSHTSLPVGITLYEVRGVRINNLVVQGFQQDGINAFDSVFETELTQLTCRGCGRTGIAVGGASQVRIDSCLVGNNGESQLRVSGYCHAALLNSRLIGTEQAPELERVGSGELIRLDDGPLALRAKEQRSAASGREAVVRY